MTINARRRSGAAALAAGALMLAACGTSSTTSTKASTAAPASAPAAKTTAASSTPAAKTAVSTAKSAAGTYLTGASGRALYLWVADPTGQSACTGACAQVWLPVIATGTPSAAGGATAGDLGTITRSDGSKQVTYKGHPLYYYAADSAAGTTHGQGSDSFGAKWWLVAPSGAAITGASTGAGSGSSGGGWG